jgi:hypothetical protein
LHPFELDKSPRTVQDPAVGAGIGVNVGTGVNAGSTVRVVAPGVLPTVAVAARVAGNEVAVGAGDALRVGVCGVGLAATTCVAVGVAVTNGVSPGLFSK